MMLSFIFHCPGFSHTVTLNGQEVGKMWSKLLLTKKLDLRRATKSLPYEAKCFMDKCYFISWF